MSGNVTEPVSVKILTSPESDGGGGTVVRLELVASFGKDGDTSVTNTTTIYDWTTPSGWTTEDLKLVTIDNGNGYTFAGDVFESSDMIGLRIRRLGSAAEDTFPNTLYIAVSMVFEYTAKQL